MGHRSHWIGHECCTFLPAPQTSKRQNCACMCGLWQSIAYCVCRANYPCVRFQIGQICVFAVFVCVWCGYVRLTLTKLSYSNKCPLPSSGNKCAAVCLLHCLHRFEYIRQLPKRRQKAKLVHSKQNTGYPKDRFNCILPFDGVLWPFNGRRIFSHIRRTHFCSGRNQLFSFAQVATSGNFTFFGSTSRYICVSLLLARHSG